MPTISFKLTPKYYLIYIFPNCRAGKLCDLGQIWLKVKNGHSSTEAVAEEGTPREVKKISFDAESSVVVSWSQLQAIDLDTYPITVFFPLFKIRVIFEFF